MDPNSSPDTDLNSESPQIASQPGQVVGPGGSIKPSLDLSHISTPASNPPLTVEPTTIVPQPHLTEPVSDLPRPTAVADSNLLASSVILPHQQSASTGVMSYNETAAASKKPIIKRIASMKMLLMIGVPIVLLGSSAAAYLGYVVPNQPDNIWASALSNTGKGYDKLSEYSQNQLSDKYKGIKVNGIFKVSGEFVADGDFHGTSSGDNVDFTGNLSSSGVKLNLNIRSINSSVGTPDIYVKVDGLQDVASLLGSNASDYGSLVNNVNGNWYYVDHSLFSQFTQDVSTNTALTQADVKSVLDAVGAAGKQNIFTSDHSKMAFVVKQKIGKEKQNGRNVYHFKVGVNKDNIKSYIRSLCANLKDSNLKKFYNNDNIALDSALDCTGIEDSISKIKDNSTADAWVDLRTKLIHKIRFTDSNNKNSYFDISQDYQGGDSLPFSISTNEKVDNTITTASLKLTLNMKTNVLLMKGSFKITGDNPTSGSIDMTVEPTSSKIDVQKPTGAKNVLQLLNDAGLGDLFGGSSFSSNGADAERKTDINALHAHVEAFQAEKGYYPNLVNLNDANWRSVNIAGINPEALKDPAGLSGQIVSLPTTHAYSYQTTPTNCDNLKVNCLGYTLTATLDDGSTYSKKDLNDPTSAAILN